MGIVKRQGIKGTIILYLGVIIGNINTLFLLPAFLELEQIGLIRTLADGALLFVPFAQLGISSITLRYLPIFSDKGQRHNNFLSLILLISTVGCLLFSVVFFLFQENIQAYLAGKSSLFENYVYYLLPLTIILTFYNAFLYYSTALFRIVVPNIIQNIFIRLGISLIVVIFWLGWFDFDGLVLAYVTLYLISVSFIILYVKQLGHFFIGWPSIKKYGTKLKEMITYGIITIFTSTGSIVVFRLDVMMITATLGLEYSGVYAIAIALSSLMEIPSRAIAQISAPVISNALKANDQQTIKEVYQKTSINNLIISTVLFLLMIVNIYELYSLIPNHDKFVAGILSFYFLGIAKVLDLATGIASSIINYSKHYVFNLVIVACLWGGGYITNHLLVGSYQLEGVAAGSAVVFLLVLIIRVIIIYIKFKVFPFTLDTLKFLLIALLTYGLFNHLFPSIDNVYLSIAIKSILLATVYGILVYYSKISADLNDLLHSVLKKYLSK